MREVQERQNRMPAASRCVGAVRLRPRLHYNCRCCSRTGRSLLQDTRQRKSELRRAVCRITSGTAGSAFPSGPLLA